MTNQQPMLTQEGLDELQQELDMLVNQKRPAAVSRVALAREQGDLSENSEYTAARDELNFIDERISELEEVVKSAKVVSGSGSKENIDIGSVVTVETKGKKDTFHMVGEHEADPKLKKISYTSPLGKALMGKRKGDSASVEAPAGTMVYKIITIE